MPKPLNDTTPIGDILHEWTIEEYERHDRNTAWYVFMGTFGVGMVTYGILSGNFLLSLIIILAAIIIFLQSHQAPLQIPFRITETGVTVGSRIYMYSELEDFYIIYQPPAVKTLFLRPKSPLRPILRIPLLDMNPVDIRHTLQEFLIENTDKEEEPMSDMVARQWKLH